MTILLSARILAELANFLKVPPVIGELLAGVLLGPTLLGWIDPNDILKLLAEIGIILLLFEVGLETDFHHLVAAGFKATIVAMGGLVFPFAFGFALSYWVFSLPLITSLFIGGTLTATSIGITVRILSDIGRAHSREGHVVLGAAVLDDVLGVIILALLYEFSIEGVVGWENAGKVGLFVTGFFVLAPPMAKLLAVFIRRYDGVSSIPGFIPTSVVSLVLFFAWLAHEVGAPEILGGFAAGLALSRRFFLPFGVALKADSEFSFRIHEQMKPVVQLFTPVFFVMVGLSLDLRAVDWGAAFIWTFSLSLLVAAVVGKFGGALFIREPWLRRVVIGMAMAPRGEVGLIFAELGRTSGVFDHEVYAGVIIVIAYTTLFSPFCIKWFYRRYGDRLD